MSAVHGCRMGRLSSLLVPILGVSLAGCAAPPAFKEVLPGVRWDSRQGLIALDATVCLERGILEYVAVAAGGKEYESAFRLHCRPAHVQQALLMAGWQPGEVAAEARGDYAEDANPVARPPGAPATAQPPADYWQRGGGPTRVEIDAEIAQADGTWPRQPLEHFLLDRATGGPPARLRFVFTGSFFAQRGEESRFAADVTLCVIALWYDPTALFNVAAQVGNPYRGAAGLELNPDTVPPRDTRVRLILRAVTGGE